jgi:hypothetical protein
MALLKFNIALEDAYGLPGALPTGNPDISGIRVDAITLIRAILVIVITPFLLGLFMDMWNRFVSNSSLVAPFNADDSSITGPIIARRLITAVSLNSTLEVVKVLMSLDNFNLYD